MATKMTSGSHRRNWTLGGAALLLALSAGAWGLLRGSGNEASALPDKYSVDHLKSLKDPREARELVRGAMQNDSLTDEQRKELRMNMRAAFEARMRERVDAYFAASDEDKTKVLDEQIDEFVEQMKKWEEARKEEEKNEKKDGDKDQSSFRNFFASASKQDRKEMSESRNPDDMARGMTYFSAMQSRMKERGIQPPRGPGGPGGGGRGPGRGP